MKLNLFKFKFHNKINKKNSINTKNGTITNCGCKVEIYKNIYIYIYIYIYISDNYEI